MHFCFVLRSIKYQSLMFAVKRRAGRATPVHEILHVPTTERKKLSLPIMLQDNSHTFIFQFFDQFF